ncbi:DNA topoisomerase, partial [Clostridioides difficile]
KYSPALYDLTELQRDANKMFGFSAKETLSIMQKLYEHHKVLTIKLLKNISITAPTLNHINVKLGVNISAIPNKTATINHISFIL